MTDFGSVVSVVRQDLLDVRRGRLMRAVLGLYVLFVGVIFVGVALTEGQTVYTAIQLTVFIGFLLVPLVSLLASYLAVAGERDSGTIRFLLGYPLERGEVLLGKYVSRFGLVAVAVGLAFLVAGVASMQLFDRPRLDAVATFGGLTLLFAGSYVGVGVAVSAASDSRGRAMTNTVAMYFVFTLLWSRLSPVTVPQIISGAANLLLGVQLSGGLWRVFTTLSPTEAYFRSLRLLPGGAFETSGSVASATVVGVLLTWMVVPPALGYLSFVRADID
ncbi:ABC transporter permease [Halorussus gelatinilyticus]|uniref:ABC transporter permease n=1 Tax=Halorussus gelatinilyticus TaxID=2937524 RepID=A0A8U0INN6_9EURY|nr:ABC transporter permease subunit [Halorussus gelatinilyticus]UPW02245.1 ABC transporter permease [Halorussus gelatinilyticus]